MKTGCADLVLRQRASQDRAWRAGHLKEGVARSCAEVPGEGICSPRVTQRPQGLLMLGAEGRIMYGTVK